MKMGEMCDVTQSRDSGTVMHINIVELSSNIFTEIHIEKLKVCSA